MTSMSKAIKIFKRISPISAGSLGQYLLSYGENYFVFFNQPFIHVS